MKKKNFVRVRVIGSLDAGSKILMADGDGELSLCEIEEYRDHFETVEVRMKGQTELTEYDRTFWVIGL